MLSRISKGDRSRSFEYVNAFLFAFSTSTGRRGRRDAADISHERSEIPSEHGLPRITVRRCFSRHPTTSSIDDPAEPHVVNENIGSLFPILTVRSVRRQVLVSQDTNEQSRDFLCHRVPTRNEIMITSPICDPEKCPDHPDMSVICRSNLKHDNAD